MRKRFFFVFLMFCLMLPLVGCTQSAGNQVSLPATEQATELPPETERGTETMSMDSETEPTEPSTEALTEPSTEALTEPSTEALTEPSTEAPTEPSTEAPTQSETSDGKIYEVPDLEGTITVPDGYHVLVGGKKYSDTECLAIGLSQSDIDLLYSGTGIQVRIIPESETYLTRSFEILLHVKGLKYPGITLSELSQSEYKLVADTVVDSFSSYGASGYDTVEDNGLRFFRFDWHPMGKNDARYATILGGHMIYIYMQNDGKRDFTQEERDLLQKIAFSIVSGL